MQLDIVLSCEYVHLLCCRIHAEFQLNELPNYPFWFTPAQFTGSIIITTDLKHIVLFNFYVPADKKLNVGKWDAWLCCPGMEF